MSTIIAGRFDAETESTRAAAALQSAGFAPAHISTFFLSPAGQSAGHHGIDSDDDEAAGPPMSSSGTAVGVATGTGVGAAAGLVATPFIGPAGPVLGAALGAYVGSLAGSLGQIEADGESSVGEDAAHPRPPKIALRRSGMMVAVTAPTPELEHSAIETLRNQGAQDLERGEGTIAEGDWKDFDPFSAPKLVDQHATRG